MNLEVGGSKASLRPGLPARIGGNRPHQVDLIGLLTAQQIICRDLALIKQEDARQQVMRLETLLNGKRYVRVTLGRRGGLHVGNQMRGLVITTLGEMHGCHRSRELSAWYDHVHQNHKAYT